MRVIYAYHVSNIPSNNGSSMDVHTSRGSKSVILANAKPPAVNTADDSSLQIMNFRVNHIRLPTNTDTLYVCQIYKLQSEAEAGGKVQMVKV